VWPDASLTLANPAGVGCQLSAKASFHLGIDDFTFDGLSLSMGESSTLSEDDQSGRICEDTQEICPGGVPDPYGPSLGFDQPLYRSVDPHTSGLESTPGVQGTKEASLLAAASNSQACLPAETAVLPGRPFINTADTCSHCSSHSEQGPQTRYVWRLLDDTALPLT